MAGAKRCERRSEARGGELKANPKLYPGAGENNVSWVHIDLEHHAWFNP
jgi:hypothetical protein